MSAQAPAPGGVNFCSPTRPPEAGPCVVPPKVISTVDPVYSEHARKAGVEGTVVLWLIVEKDGNPRDDIRVARSLDKELDQAAVDAVRKWKFQPATLQGKPVAVQFTVEVNFRLQDKKRAFPGKVIGGVFPTSGKRDEPLRVCKSPGAPEGGACATAPKAIQFREADYTDQARRAKLQGTVLLDIVVDSEGNVAKAQVLKGLGMGLDENSLAAVGKWKFTPGTYEGKPVAAALQVEMTFHVR